MSSAVLFVAFKGRGGGFAEGSVTAGNESKDDLNAGAS